VNTKLTKQLFFRFTPTLKGGGKSIELNKRTRRITNHPSPLGVQGSNEI